MGSLIAIALLGSTAGLAFATGRVTADEEVIRACVNNQNGKVRIVSRAGSCRGNEHVISWNVQGPPGSPGAIETHVAFTNETLDPGELALVIARCPAGEIATGGGFGSNSGLIRVIGSEPIPPIGGSPTAWGVNALNTSPGLEIQSVAYVVCATGP